MNARQLIEGFSAVNACEIEESHTVELRHSDEAYDWNGLPVTAGQNDAGDPFECISAYAVGRLVGSVIYQNVGDFVWIEHLYVLPKFRRQGIAELLLKRVMTENPNGRIEGGWQSDEMVALAKKLGFATSLG